MENISQNRIPNYHENFFQKVCSMTTVRVGYVILAALDCFRGDSYAAFNNFTTCTAIHLKCEALKIIDLIGIINLRGWAYEDKWEASPTVDGGVQFLKKREWGEPCRGAHAMEAYYESENTSYFGFWAKNINDLTPLIILTTAYVIIEIYARIKNQKKQASVGDQVFAEIDKEQVDLRRQQNVNELKQAQISTRVRIRDNFIGDLENRISKLPVDAFKNLMYYSTGIDPSTVVKNNSVILKKSELGRELAKLIYLQYARKDDLDLPMSIEKSQGINTYRDWQAQNINNPQAIAQRRFLVNKLQPKIGKSTVALQSALEDEEGHNEAAWKKFENQFDRVFLESLIQSITEHRTKQ